MASRETPAGSDALRLCCCTDGTEDSTSLSPLRTCGHAGLSAHAGGRFTDHVARSRLFARGNLSLGNPLHDHERNLLEVHSGLAHTLAFFRHQGTVLLRASYGSSLLENERFVRIVVVCSIGGSSTRLTRCTPTAGQTLRLRGRAHTCEPRHGEIRLRHVSLRFVHTQRRGDGRSDQEGSDELYGYAAG